MLFAEPASGGEAIVRLRPAIGGSHPDLIRRGAHTASPSRPLPDLLGEIQFSSPPSPREKGPDSGERGRAGRRNPHHFPGPALRGASGHHRWPLRGGRGHPSPRDTSWQEAAPRPCAHPRPPSRPPELCFRGGVGGGNYGPTRQLPGFCHQSNYPQVIVPFLPCRRQNGGRDSSEIDCAPAEHNVVAQVVGAR